jgi:cation diffusion facilitator CzcD-associated flavoprotein CzcO
MGTQTNKEDTNFYNTRRDEGPRVCVVGAGPSGLTTTKTLLGAGLDVDCFDISPHIGGHWVIENPNGKSSAYRSLRTNTTKRMSRFSDFEMPADWPEFPTYDYVRTWLESYVDAFNFRQNISTGTEVVSAVPRPEGGWQVTLERDGVRSTASYDALVAASGSYWDQQVPKWPGHFDGTIFHAQDYLDPTTPHDTKGKNVVVIGVGNTGCELACEIARSDAQNVYLSARSGTWIMPKTIDGVPAAEGVPMNHPTDDIPIELQQQSEAEREQLLESLASQKIKETYGERMRRFEELGLPPAPEQPLLKRPTMSQDLLEHLEKGDLRAMPAIAELKGDSVLFDNGETFEADIIICATGYKLTYPYLSPEIADTSDNDLTLFCGIVPPERRDLFFVGVSRPSGAFWPVAEAQAKFVAALLSGSYILPDQDELDRRSRPVLNRPAMSPGLYGYTLREELARETT